MPAVTTNRDLGVDNSPATGITTLHMGMHTPSDTVRLVRGWWTLDGQQVGPPIGMGSIIYRGLPLPPESVPETTSQELWLANDMAGSPLEVQMLQWAMLPTAMPLEDMLWDDVILRLFPASYPHPATSPYVIR